MLIHPAPGDSLRQELPRPDSETTVDALLGVARRALHEAGLDDARREARWLLARVLALSESRLLTHPDEPVDPADATRYHDAVRRRAAREPFAHIVGECEFYGRPFVVDRRVLVPRPETEHLVAEALDIVARRTQSTPSPVLVVDVGTGSGAIACTLAAEVDAGAARVVGCDVSADVLAVAALNRDRLGLGDRVQLICGSLLTWLREPADLVLGNLPYIPAARIPTLMPEVADWEPHEALDGGSDGLDLVRALLADASRAVRPGGTILLELDPDQMQPACALLPSAKSRVVRDLAGLDRVLRLDLP